MMQCLTNRIMSMEPVLERDDEHYNCLTCIPAAGAEISVAPARVAVMRAPRGTGLEKTTSYGWGPYRTVLSPTHRGSDFQDLEMPWHVPSRHIVSNAEWRELVALLERITGRGAAPAVEIGPALKAKICSSNSHKRFVEAVIQACQSSRAAQLGVTKYMIDEDYNVEKPQWVTITLTVWFSDRDLAARMDAWGEMRRIVDKYIVPLCDGEGGGNEMRDIDSRFFISMGSRYV